MTDLHDIRFGKRVSTEHQRLRREAQEEPAPMVLTINGRAELVVQDAKSYQEMLNKLHEAETVAALRASFEGFERGEGIPWAKAKAKLMKKHGL